MTASALSFSAVAVTLSPCACSGVEVPETSAARESCAGGHMWAGLTGRDPAHRPTGALASPGLLAESGIGRDLETGVVVLQDHRCPHPVWQRGCAAPAGICDVGLMLRWWVAAWAAAEISPSRGFLLHSP